MRLTPRSAEDADQHAARDDERGAEREPPPDALGAEAGARRAPTPQSDSVATSGATTLSRPR